LKITEASASRAKTYATDVNLFHEIARNCPLPALWLDTRFPMNELPIAAPTRPDPESSNRLTVTME
jgi:hypothetical protein